mmetsp:Transcript_77549/g.146345  ORF Transcript_77549/g.146345 Transcript_77549/m.146345 type:complete len:200 (+) Transcript_77549:622-1221(+)
MCRLCLILSLPTAKKDVPRPIVRLPLKELDHGDLKARPLLVPIVHHHPIIAEHQVNGSCTTKDAALMKHMPGDDVQNIQIQRRCVAFLCEVLGSYSQQVWIDVSVQDGCVALDVHRHVIPIAMLGCRGSNDTLSDGAQLNVPHSHKLLALVLLVHCEPLHHLCLTVNFIMEKPIQARLKQSCCFFRCAWHCMHMARRVD